MKGTQASQLPIDIYLRMLILSLLIAWCFFIARPFLVIMIWAIIIAVAVYPIHKRLINFLGGRRLLAIGIFILIVLSLFVMPSIPIAKSILSHNKEIRSFLQDPEAQLPRPNPEVADWPVVGKQVYEKWVDATVNIESFLQEHTEQVSGIVGWLLKGIGTVLADIFISFVSMLIAAFFLYHSEVFYQGTIRFAKRLLGETGEEYVKISRDTIKSIVQGVILIAIIQAGLAYLGMAIFGLRLAGLFAIIVMILAVIQMPMMLITIPLAIYGFTVAETSSAIVFAVYIMILGLLDNILKPIFLGRGLTVPMILILIGSLGGLMLHGLLGLFVGAVVMAIGFQTYRLWLDMDGLGDKSPESTKS